jgi:Sulfotransferase family
MAIICRDYNLLFIMTPRTACTAIGELLCEYYGGRFLPAEDILDSRGRILVQKKHSTLSELIRYKFLAREEAQSLLKITAVRNPFDSLVSVYFKQRFKYQPLLGDPASWVNRSPRYARRMKYAQKHSFNEWFFRISTGRLIRRLLLGHPSLFENYTRGVDVVLRYENLEHDLKGVFKRAGVPWKTDLRVVNRTDERPDRDYRSFYSRPAALVAKFTYSHDLKRYGYQF